MRIPKQRTGIQRKGRSISYGMPPVDLKNCEVPPPRLSESRKALNSGAKAMTLEQKCWLHAMGLT